MTLEGLGAQRRLAFVRSSPKGAQGGREARNGA